MMEHVLRLIPRPSTIAAGHRRMSSKTGLPATFRKVVVKKLTQNFAEATEIVTVPLMKPQPKEVLIRNRYVGINASDINMTAGRYFSSKPLPFDAGFESVGEVVALGSEVHNLKVGQAVASINFGSFAEYVCVPSQIVWDLPEMNPDFVAMLVSGRTAAISLDKAGHIKKGRTVLITAAAGGTGSLAVQYAKYSGCHVIGTCSSEEKMQFLKSIGCDRPVNYKTENLHEILKKEYPNGVDVVWESIGGDMFKTCLNNLAIRGNLIVIGYITHYQSDKGYTPLDLGSLPQRLLVSSGSVTGFMLTHYPEEFQYYHVKLLSLYESQKLKVQTDQGAATPGGAFVGLESINRAVKHLHGGQSFGKVIVELPW